MTLLIREFVESDRPPLRALYAASRRAAFPWLPPASLRPEDFDQDTREERVFVAQCGDMRVGFASIWPPDDFLHNLFVHPDYQGRGIGRALLDCCVRHFKGPATLKCLQANSRACAFYLHFGWRVVGTGDSCDGPYQLMRRDSPPG
jgi:GNAT superfamily N-acetyltransferase